MKVKPGERKGRVTVEIGGRDATLLANASTHPLPIRKILVPIDFSEFSYKSLDYAAAFAEQSGAEIILLHVVPLTYVNTELVAFDYSEISKRAAETSREELEKVAKNRLPGKPGAQLATRIGRPVEEIIGAAQDFDADLIIMSTHGYTGLKHAFLGSTTENVVRYAPCPVLTVRQNEHDFVNALTERSK